MSRLNDALRHAASRTGEAGESAAVPQSREEAFSAPGAFPAESAAANPPEGGGGHGQLLQAEDPYVSRGFNPAWTDRLATSPTANSVLVEQFRRLAGLLHHAQSTGPLKRVMVTSAVPGDGKTLTAVNLALTLSESYGRSVLLIDGDLRRPSIHDLWQLDNVAGLSDGLRRTADQKLAILRLTATLTLLPAGPPVSDPMRSLTSKRMRRILEEAAERFDWVIIDAPPVGTVADAALLSAMVDTSLLVVRAGRTPHRMVEAAIESLGAARIFGIVLNAADGAETDPYGHYYDYTASRAAPPG